MATCKDCLYYPHCYSRIAFMMDVDEVRGELLTDLDKRCKGFQNKADVVPVVRCKDCLYYFPPFCKRPKNRPNHTHAIMPDDYCSYGERKVDNAE